MAYERLYFSSIAANDHRLSGLKLHPLINSQLHISEVQAAQLGCLVGLPQGQNQGVSWAGLLSGASGKHPLADSFRLLAESSFVWL